MKNFRITYRLFAGTTLESNDIVIPAADEVQARAAFENRYTGFFFVVTKEE